MPNKRTTKKLPVQFYVAADMRKAATKKAQLTGISVASFLRVQLAIFVESPTGKIVEMIEQHQKTVLKGQGK